MTGSEQLFTPAGLYRSLDASGNRLSEGLRVLEDQCRFALGLGRQAVLLKTIRHRSRNVLQPLTPHLLQCRNTARRQGLDRFAILRQGNPPIPPAPYGGQFQTQRRSLPDPLRSGKNPAADDS